MEQEIICSKCKGTKVVSMEDYFWTEWNIDYRTIEIPCDQCKGQGVEIDKGDK